MILLYFFFPKSMTWSLEQSQETDFISLHLPWLPRIWTKIIYFPELPNLAHSHGTCSFIPIPWGPTRPYSHCAMQPAELSVSVQSMSLNSTVKGFYVTLMNYSPFSPMSPIWFIITPPPDPTALPNSLPFSKILCRYLHKNAKLLISFFCLHTTIKWLSIDVIG